MPNRTRPRCPTCHVAMVPVYCKGPRGVSFIRVEDYFWCPTDRKMAAGRKKTAFLHHAGTSARPSRRAGHSEVA